MLEFAEGRKKTDLNKESGVSWWIKSIFITSWFNDNIMFLSSVKCQASFPGGLDWRRWGIYWDEELDFIVEILTIFKFSFFYNQFQTDF